MNWVWGPLFSIVFSLTAIAESRVQGGQLWNSNFFENSQRIDPDIVQAKAIVVVQTDSGRCAGFFVRNRTNRLLIGTARHCAAYEMAKACRENSVRLAIPDASFQGSCKQIVMENQHADFTIFEASFDDEAQLRRSIRFLTLSSRKPPMCASLAMLGFPADHSSGDHVGREGKFTLSNNCWVSNGKGQIEFSDLPPDVQESTRRLQSQRGTANADFNRLAALITTTYSGFHNCSIYGGNSGGPIIYSGTETVAALPSGFWPGLIEEQPSSASMPMETVNAVMSLPTTKTQADAVGIVFANPPSYRHRDCPLGNDL